MPRNDTYRWIRSWVLIHNATKDGPPPLVGEIIKVGKADGSVDFLEVDGTMAFTAKNGDTCFRMYTKPEDNG